MTWWDPEVSANARGGFGAVNEDESSVREVLKDE